MDGTADTSVLVIDLEALAAGHEELNLPLRAGDVLNVPRAGSYYVTGAVERPGAFFLKSKTTLQQALATAGGLKKLADRSRIRIYRPSPSGGAEVLVVDLEAIEKGAPAPELQKNDVVVVAESGAKRFLYGFLDWVKGIFGISIGASKSL
ncbi:MAG TPA: SLBB domain-containing protein [Thermodesulfobacteriota bacterium]|nr:SLBB domain-containing protein [Thermodesulfobacteriota bacterium]